MRNDKVDMTKEQEIKSCDVAIIGAGPSGLSLAIELKKSGIERVIVIDREINAGGILRHCGHPPFGMREFNRIYSGPTYAKKLVATAIKEKVEILSHTTVASIDEVLTLSNDDGISKLSAKRVVIATGVRETPRSTRLVTGQRPKGIATTGALQSMVYLEKQVPCKAPVIVGTELVAFSSLLTLRSAGIKPIAMIEANNRISSRFFNAWFAKILRIPIYLNTQIDRINGEKFVDSVDVKNQQTQVIKNIPCDGVIFTGCFVPEVSLLRMANISIDQYTKGPVVNQYGQCSDKKIYAVGNVLRPVETAGWCWQEGKESAHFIVNDLQQEAQKIKPEIIDNTLFKNNEVDIHINDRVIEYIMPQKISVTTKCISGKATDGMKYLQCRFKHQNKKSMIKGQLVVIINDKKVWQKNYSAVAQRRVLVPMKIFSQINVSDKVCVDFIEKKT